MARRRADACYRELGAELRKRRIAANLTMRELAYHLDWSPSTVSWVESGYIGLPTTLLGRDTRHASEPSRHISPARHESDPYNGRRRCEQLVIEELRGPRWSSVVLNIQRHTPHTDTAGNTKDILTSLEPGDTRVFRVEQNTHGKPGEIRLRLTATIDGYEHPPIVESCDVKLPAEPGVRWLHE